MASDHPIHISPVAGRVRVTWRGKVIADSDGALELREHTYPPVLYIPRGDAKMAHFTRTEHHTGCPYKGEATYFSLVAGQHRAENAVWSYETPYPAMAAIAEHLAFYPNQVTIERG